MKSLRLSFVASVFMLLAGALLAGAVGASTTVSVFATASGVVDPSGTAVKGPDSLSLFNGSIWALFTNGASKTCAGGNSTAVQYDTSGNVLQTYSVPNYVDGLRGNPADGTIWALQCEDGNSTLTIINPATHTQSAGASYAVPSSSRGYDDAVFSGSSIWISNTNPANTGDPVIVTVNAGTNPVTIGATLLAFGATGKNLASGMTETIPLNDPDSMILTPSGSLMLTSGDDGAFTFVANPGTTNSPVSFLQLLDPSTGAALASPAGLDDGVFATSASGTFYVADTGNNRILAIHATGLTSGSLYASVGSLNIFALVDMATGKLTPLVSGISAPHGATFVPDPAGGITLEVSTSLFASASTVVDPMGTKVKGPDSLSYFNGSLWALWTNGASKTCGGGNSTAVEYSLDDEAQQTYSIPNYVDGLRGNPADGTVWALQCEDGNSTLTTINPATQTVGAAAPYAMPSSSRGYDDAVFSGSSVWFSNTNPASNGDPVIVTVNAGTNPVTIGATLLAFGASGTNLANGQSQTIPLNDPDSMILTPRGSLMLTSGDDGAFTFLADPGGKNTASFLQLLDPSTGAALTSPAGLDDGVFATSASGTFYVSDTSNNQIVAIRAKGLIPGSLYASVGSLNTFALVDQGTGALTPLVSLNVPHGATFVPDPPGVAIEYYNASLGNYLSTSNAAEISSLDKGGAWVRTGYSFKVFPVVTGGTYPVCRFLIVPPGNSHFLTASPDECLAIQNTPAFSEFVLESPNTFWIYLPDLVSGNCQSGTIPVYRLWDAKANEDHRYTTSLAVRTQMIAMGYVSEGYGPMGVAMCSPR